ncbi:putative alanine--glyoxylate transaminase [Dioscorea sansibarensis]
MPDPLYISRIALTLLLNPRDKAQLWCTFGRTVTMKRLLIGRLSSLHRRAFSRLAETETLPVESSGIVPIMAPCDYSPPPYYGPPTSEVLRKRAEFLNPTMLYLYKNLKEVLANGNFKLF